MGQTVNLLSFDFGGSNPSAPTNYIICGSLLQDERKLAFAARRSEDLRKIFAKQKSCGNSSVDRALAFQAGGRGFESRFPLKYLYPV